MLQITNITKTYHKGSEAFTALDNLSINFNEGEFVVVSGASGAGKSTLLNIIGGLIIPDSGSVLFNGNDIYLQSSRATDEYRRNHIGFMFQQFHLMPYLTVLENIRLACRGREQPDEIESYLEKCSITALKNKYPDEISVGEKQRTAFIRAIISDPEILLADEPTGNLDPENSKILMLLIDEFHKKGGTVILVSHDPLTAQFASRKIILEKGKLV